MDWHAAVRMALEELTHHKLRTSLTLLGMIFGVGAVIAMLSVGAGAQQEALRAIDTLGLRTIIVQAKTLPDEKLKEVREKSPGLTLRDLEVARETLPLLTGQSAQKKVALWALYSAFGRSEAKVIGVSPGHFSMTGLRPIAGRPLLDLDEETFARVAVIGDRAARDLFGPEDPLGKLIRVNHLWFTVVGVLAERSMTKTEFQGVKLEGPENTVFLPLSTTLKQFKFKPLEDEVDAIQVEVREGIDPSWAASTLSRLMETRHRGIDDFSMIVPADLLAQARKTQRIFTIVMASIAGISLLVGGIGIMNIMLATVLERTREIGIRRALGARRIDIRNQFLVETLTITALGGLIGVVVGIGLAFAIAAFSGWKVGWSPSAVILALGVSAAVGLASGLYPALTAAKLDPIEALQREVA